MVINDRYDMFAGKQTLFTTVQGISGNLKIY